MCPDIRGLTHLHAAEFLYETSLFPDRVYTFKHALTHEVAYGSLLQERRRMLHARIVEALEAQGDDRVAEQVERLAYHARRGEVWDKALRYGRKAGEKAKTRAANQEAVTCFEQALDALRHLPEGPDTVGQGIDVRIELRDTLLPLGDYARILAHLQDAEKLAETLDDPYRLGWISAKLTHYFWIMRNLDRALTYGQRALALAEPLGDVRLFTQANFVLAEVHYQLGNYDQAIAAFEQNVARLTGDRLYERIGAAVLSVVSRRWLVQALSDRGAFAAGLSRGEEAVRIAEAADHPYSLANACLGLGYLYVQKGDAQQAVPCLTRGLELCQRWHLPQIVTGLILTLSHALALSGRISEALAFLEQGGEMADLTRVIGRQSERACTLSEIYWRSGHDAEAKKLAAQAHKRAHETKERGHEAYALRLLGDIALHHKPPDIEHAATHYQHALTLANELGMRPLQAHCHRGLGTLYHRTGQV